MRILGFVDENTFILQASKNELLGLTARQPNADASDLTVGKRVDIIDLIRSLRGANKVAVRTRIQELRATLTELETAADVVDAETT